MISEGCIIGRVPTYQYACTSCGHQLEAVQTFDDAPLTDCPECAGRLRKLFSSVGIVFKGSGFYRTDSRAAEAKSDSGAGTPAEATPARDSGKEPVKSTSGTESSSGSSGSASSGGATESTSGKASPDKSSSGKGSSKGSRTSAKATSAA